MNVKVTGIRISSDGLDAGNLRFLIFEGRAAGTDGCLNWRL